MRSPAQVRSTAGSFASGSVETPAVLPEQARRNPTLEPREATAEEGKVGVGDRRRDFGLGHSAFEVANRAGY